MFFRDLLPEEFNDTVYAVPQLEIGRGVYGRVFSIAGTDQAFKQLSATDSKGGHDPAFSEMANFECAVTMKLCCVPAPHPNVAHVTDIFTVSLYSLHIICMENYTGGSLKERIIARRGQGPPDDVWTVAKQLMAALAYCHENAVVHCDVKAHNIMFDSKGVLKLIDFSNARYACELGRVIMPATDQTLAPGIYDDDICSPECRPPEAALRTLAMYSGGTARRGLNLEDVAECTTAIDMWSAGCVLVEYLTDGMPFNDEGNKQILCSIVRRIGMPHEQDSPARTPASLVSVENYIRDVLLPMPPKKRISACATSLLSAAPHRDDSLWGMVEARSHDPAMWNLLRSMICWDPRARCSAPDALEMCESILSARQDY